jgi:hypothetical protein
LVALVFIGGKFLREWLLVECLQQYGKQLADRHWESRRLDFPLTVDLISVATSDTCLGEITGLLEIVDDLNRRSLRDPYLLRDVPQARVRVHGDVGEHVAVVRHQAPTRICVSGT